MGWRPIHRLRSAVLWLLLAGVWMAVACGGGEPLPAPADTVSDTAAPLPPTPPPPQPDSPTEAHLRSLGLVDVQELDPSIVVRLTYATTDNFVGRVLYADLQKAFFQPQLAECLAEAQAALRADHPHLSLLVLDAARPLSVQYAMFHIVAGTPQNIYVSNPRHSPSLHNYGAAVDVALADTAGRMLDMGSPFDHFGPEAHIDREEELLRRGLITPQAFHNRRLLRRLMQDQGLLPLRTEWWHFNLMSRQQAQRQFSVID